MRTTEPEHPEIANPARTAGARREDLAAALGVQDAAALDALLAVGIDADTLAAVDWIPMVLVAWADGDVQPPEREAIQRAARRAGLLPGSPARALLDGWLEEPPPPGLLEAWRLHLGALARRDGTAGLGQREVWTRRRAREVAEAAGGWLGLASVSAAESAVMLEIARSYESARRA